MKSVGFLSVSVCILSAFVCAGTYQIDTVAYTAGTGSNSAKIVIDFDFNNYFVFEYLWDGVATGWDALSALEQQSELTIEGGSYQMVVNGQLLTLAYANDFVYPSGAKYDYFDDGSLGWAYVGSIDNENWQSNAPVSLRELTNGSWDAWVWTNHDMDNNWVPVRQPGQMPIPEPVSIIVMAAGVILARKRRAV